MRHDKNGSNEASGRGLEEHTIKRYLDEPGMAPETARAMSDAFMTVTARVQELGLVFSSAGIAQKLSSLVQEGETDAVRLVEAVLEGLLPRKE